MYKLRISAARLEKRIGRAHRSYCFDLCSLTPGQTQLLDCIAYNSEILFRVISPDAL